MVHKGRSSRRKKIAFAAQITEVPARPGESRFHVRQGALHDLPGAGEAVREWAERQKALDAERDRQ